MTDDGSVSENFATFVLDDFERERAMGKCVKK